MTNFFHQHMPGQFRWGAPSETPLVMLSFMEAATLFLYQISVNAEGQDVPIASSFSVKMSPQLYLTSALMELALHGYVQMDEVKPLQNYARSEPTNRAVHGQLVVLREPPTGDAVLDEVLWHMQPMGHSRSVKDWLVSPLIVTAKERQCVAKTRVVYHKARESSPQGRFLTT